MTAEPLWRGPAGVLPPLLDLKGVTQAFGVGVDDPVEVWPAGDRTPSREQVLDAMHGCCRLWSLTDDGYCEACEQRADAVMALLSGTEGDTPDG